MHKTNRTLVFAVAGYDRTRQQAVFDSLVCALRAGVDPFKTFPPLYPLLLRAIYKGYGSVVYLLADLEQLAAADVFVGTCSSNIGRLVMVLRDGLGKEKDSSISLDLPWYPKRERGLALD